jgi:hypothetical protein
MNRFFPGGVAQLSNIPADSVLFELARVLVFH